MEVKQVGGGHETDDKGEKKPRRLVGAMRGVDGGLVSVVGVNRGLVAGVDHPVAEQQGAADIVGRIEQGHGLVIQNNRGCSLGNTLCRTKAAGSRVGDRLYPADLLG